MAQKITNKQYARQSDEYTTQELMKLNKLLQDHDNELQHNQSMKRKRGRDDLNIITTTTTIQPNIETKMSSNLSTRKNENDIYFRNKIEILENKIMKITNELKSIETHADDLENELNASDTKLHYLRLEFSNIKIELENKQTENEILTKELMRYKKIYNYILIWFIICIISTVFLCFLM